MELTSIKKINDGTYILNDSIVVKDFEFEEDGVFYTIDFDESLVSEKEAAFLGEKFVNDALTAAIQKNEKE